MANEFVARKGLIVPSGGMSFSGSFMPNGLGGTAGYVLTSSGLASTPYWNASSGPISITPGAVVFGSTSSGIGEDPTKFFWDDTSNCLSIGTSSATGSLHVVGTTVIREGSLRLATDWPAGTSIQLYSPNLPSYSNWIWLNRVNGAGMAIYCGDSGLYNFTIGANGSFRLGGSAYQYGHIISDTGGRVLIGNVDINGTPDVSSIFELRGTLGFLPSRLTSTQKFAIPGPTAGLEVYDSTLNQKSIYNGVTWSSISDNGDVTKVSSSGVVTTYISSSNNDSSRGTLLMQAINSATSGDNFYLSGEKFNIGFTGIDLSLGRLGNTGLTGISLHGAGKYRTVIESTLGSATLGDVPPIINVGSNTEVSDLSIISNVGASFSIPWGLYDTVSTAPITNASIRNVYISGQSDGIYINKLQPGTCSFFAYGMTIQTLWDCVVLNCNSIGSVLNIYDSICIATASTVINRMQNTRGITLAKGILNSYNNQIECSGGTVSNQGYANSNVGSVLNVYGGSILTSGNDSVDLANGVGNINIYSNTNYDPTKVTTTPVYADSTQIRHSIAYGGTNSYILQKLAGVAQWVDPSAFGGFQGFQGIAGAAGTGSGGSSISGGTTNYLVKYLSATSITASTFNENGGSIGIGTASTGGYRLLMAPNSNGNYLAFRGNNGAFSDTVTLDLQPFDYNSSFKSMYFNYKGSSTTGDIFGINDTIANADLSQIIMGGNNSIIQTIGATNSLRFFINGDKSIYMGATGMYSFGTASFGRRVNVSGSVDISGSFGAAITATSSNITLDETHHTLIITGGTPTVTLPAANNATRRIYIIVNQTGTARTISAYLDFSGATSTSVPATQSIEIQSDGTNWYQIKN